MAAGYAHSALSRLHEACFCMHQQHLARDSAATAAAGLSACAVQHVLEDYENEGCDDMLSLISCNSADNLSWLQPTIQITIEVLHLVFSAFGFVHKLATFEKAAGFQALVQYGDSETADQVRQALDGRHIPRHVLNDHPNPPMLKLSFSQHTDLNVKFQSHRSR